MTHEILLDADGFVTFHKRERTALIVDKPIAASYQKHEIVILKCNDSKWKNNEVYAKISFIDYLPQNKLLLHFKNATT